MRRKPGKRQRHSAALKAQVALASVRELETVGELAGRYGVHPTLIHHWKRRLVEGAAELFERPGNGTQPDQAEREAELYAQIGRLQMELEWLKKKVARWDAGTA